MRYHHIVFAASLLLTSCGTFETITPFSTNHVVNGCVITAANYQAALDAKKTLDPTYHSRIFIVGYTNKEGFKVYHAYCLWRARGLYFAYDSSGTVRIYPDMQGKPSVFQFSHQLRRNAFTAFFEGVNGDDYDFEN